MWEEIQANNFFWNLMAYRHTLAKAEDFSNAEGDSDFANKCGETRKIIETQIDKHWNGQYIWSTENRMVDASVLHAIVSFDKYYDLNDDKILDTIAYYNRVFCSIFPVN